MNRKIRVLIPDGESHFATSVVRGLARQGSFRTFILSRQPNSPVRFSRYCHRYELFESKEQEPHALVEHMIRRAKACKIDVVLPVHSAIPLVAQHRELFERAGVRLAPTPSVESCNVAEDKIEFSKFVKKHSLPHPVTTVLDQTHETELDLKTLRFPVLYKPSMAGNGIGIKRFEDRASLANFVRRNPSKQAVIQEEIEGEDIDCSVLCDEGQILAATVQRALVPNVAEFRAAEVIEFVHDDQVLRIVSELVRCLNWSGVAHIDLRYSAERDQLFLIEMNPRFWGSLLGSVNAGVNFASYACQFALGGDAPNPNYRTGSRYAGTTGYLRQLKRSFTNSANRVTLTNSQAIYAITDPGPEIREFAKKWSRNS